MPLTTRGIVYHYPLRKEHDPHRCVVSHGASGLEGHGESTNVSPLEAMAEAVAQAEADLEERLEEHNAASLVVEPSHGQISNVRPVTGRSKPWPRHA